MKSPVFHPGLNHALAGRGVTPRHVTTFDAATVLQEALAAFLHGEDDSVGARTRLGRTLGKAALCALPPAGRALAYRLGARAEAVPPSALQNFRSEAVTRWIASRYPRRRYPVVFLGASNGAAVHLAAAVGAPWLPQNHLVLVRARGLDPDDPARSLELGRRAARPLLAHAPELALHQVQDPVQDRLMSQEALYFRLKRLTLGVAYERFLLERLEPGGTLVLVDCKATWPSLRVGERHVFQLGGIGALTAEDYYDGSDSVRAFLAEQGSPKTRWQLSPNSEASSGRVRSTDEPEAEWGYAPQLTTDVLRFANRHGYRVERLSFEHPERLSPWVANYYREHVVPGSGAPERLLVESLVLLDPAGVRRTASVPFWTVSNARASAEALAHYLDESKAFEEIRAVLFSSGVRAPGTATLEDWLRALRRARRSHGWLGVDTNDYPADFGVFLRYHDALRALPDAPRRPADRPWSGVIAFAGSQQAPPGVRLERICD
jgi:hypothetical protein